MSLSRIEIRNFQSLRSVDLDLGAFTVIVGASSSGKSALIRCFRAIASNVRGGSVITRGQKRTAITVRTQGHTVTLERGETSGLYRLADGSGTELTFTKLNGGVPEAVTKALRIAPIPSGGTSVNFAGQFDRPYLLDESGANVARMLGELTNVSTIFEAVRTANKRRLAASSLLKTRQADLEAVRTRLATFQGLPWRRERQAGAERKLLEAKALAEQIHRTEQILNVLELAEEARARYGSLPPIPTGDELDAANNQYLDVVGKLRGYQAKWQRWATSQDDARARAEQIAALSAELEGLLKQAGICPTCGQTTV